MRPLEFEEDLFFGSTTNSLEEASLGIIGIPWHEFSSFRKCSAQAPDGLRLATSNKLYNPFTETLIDIRDKWKVFDAGNILIESQSPEITYNSIFRKIKDITTQNSSLKYLFLGGDHLITYFSLKALNEVFHKPVGILYLDAHPDLYPEYNGNPYSHACVLQRIIDETAIQPNKIIQIGIRASTPNQQRFCESKNIRSISVANYLSNTGQFSKEYFQEAFTDVEGVYLSIDLDVLDPAFAPGVGNPEPGGLSTRNLVNLINQFQGLPLLGFDIVEYCPLFDHSNITAFAAAKCIKEVLGVMDSGKLLRV